MKPIMTGGLMALFLASSIWAQGDANRKHIEIRTDDGQGFVIVMDGDHVISIDGKNVITEKHSVTRKSSKKSAPKAGQFVIGSKDDSRVILKGKRLPHPPKAKAPICPGQKEVGGTFMLSTDGEPQVVIGSKDLSFGSTKSLPQGSYRLAKPDGAGALHLFEFDGEHAKGKKGKQGAWIGLRDGAAAWLDTTIDPKMKEQGKQALLFLKDVSEGENSHSLSGTMELLPLLKKGYGLSKGMQSGELHLPKLLEDLEEEFEHHIEIDLGDICPALDGIEIDVEINIEIEVDSDDDDDDRKHGRRGQREHRSETTRRGLFGLKRAEQEKRRADAAKRRAEMAIERQHAMELRKRESKQRQAEAKERRFKARQRQTEERDRQKQRARDAYDSRLPRARSKRPTEIPSGGDWQRKSQHLKDLEAKRHALESQIREVERALKGIEKRKSKQKNKDSRKQKRSKKSQGQNKSRRTRVMHGDAIEADLEIIEEIEDIIEEVHEIERVLERSQAGDKRKIYRKAKRI